MSAWLFQDHRQKKRLGDHCPWSVGWVDPEGRRRSKKVGTHSRAEKYARTIEGKIAAGTYFADNRKSWKDFRDEYERRILAGMQPSTKRNTEESLDNFEELAKPVKVQAIKTATIDDFVAERRKQPGKKPGSTVSPATVNKDLRHLKAVLRVAHEWGYLPKLPKVRMLREPKKLARYVSGEHFAAIYQACSSATFPAGLPYPAADWWRGLLTMCYMTGWRISEVLSLRRRDLDLEAGVAITRHADNKGKRDDRVPLHPVVVAHLERLKGFQAVVFPWSKDLTALWVEFARIQEAAGINLTCGERHEHTDACHRYGFHDFRRAFATMNADRLSADALQSLMRHQSYLTTQKYINLARQLNRSVEALHVPEFLEAETA
jgi:integrase